MSYADKTNYKFTGRVFKMIDFKKYESGHYFKPGVEYREIESEFGDVRTKDYLLLESNSGYAKFAQKSRFKEIKKSLFAKLKDIFKWKK